MSSHAAKLGLVPKAFDREIFCSYKLHESLTKAFPKRMVLADRHVSDNIFYYFGKGGHVRMVDTIERSIWECAETPPWMDKIRQLSRG